jgi:hypothetical protein
MNSITQIVVRGFTATSNIDERKREIEAAALASTQDKDAISSKLTEFEKTLSSKTEKLAVAVATAALLESIASTATSRIASSEAMREATGVAYSEGKDILNSQLAEGAEFQATATAAAFTSRLPRSPISELEATPANTASLEIAVSPANSKFSELEASLDAAAVAAPLLVLESAGALASVDLNAAALTATSKIAELEAYLNAASFAVAGASSLEASRRESESASQTLSDRLASQTFELESFSNERTRSCSSYQRKVAEVRRSERV